MAKATPAEATFPARQAPAGSVHEWYDYDGRHDATVPADGLFLPQNQSEVEHADRQGWPLAKSTKPAAKAAEETD